MSPRLQSNFKCNAKNASKGWFGRLTPDHRFVPNSCVRLIEWIGIFASKTDVMKDLAHRACKEKDPALAIERQWQMNSTTLNGRITWSYTRQMTILIGSRREIGYDNVTSRHPLTSWRRSIYKA